MIMLLAAMLCSASVSLVCPSESSDAVENGGSSERGRYRSAARTFEMYTESADTSSTVMRRRARLARFWQ